MKRHYRVWVAMGFLVVSAAALADDDCQKMGMGMMGGGDGKITKEEFMKHAEERFTHMDINGDGVIDASERKKMHEHMQHCMSMMKEHKGMMGGKATPPSKPEGGQSTPPSTP